MILQTKIGLNRAANQIDYNSRLLFLGSCFSNNIGSRFTYFKFQSLQNPFGVLFQPKAIENLITRAINSEVYIEDEVFFLNERWHCFDAHSDISDVSKEKLLKKLNAALLQTKEQLAKSSHVIITLGTAWVYRKIDSKRVVANCHKVSHKEFSKELLTVADIKESIEKIRQSILSVNTKAQIIFSVSPIRHLKDGFVENQRSKAHLITALHNQLEIFSRETEKEIKEQIRVPPSGVRGGCHYFPSYEIMMDELRDYRFYNTDMVHPNDLAITYIWEKFKEVWIAEKTHNILNKVDAVQKGLLHRPFNATSKKHQLFLKELDNKITYLKQEYPHISFAR